jgi:hypothetical protein
VAAKRSTRLRAWRTSRPAVLKIRKRSRLGRARYNSAGVPTSTALANLVLLRVDSRMMRLQEQHHFNYSRWVDDLTFSGSPRLLKLRRLLQRIIEDEGFKVKESKTATMLANERQVVTNLVVNSKVNLPREKRAEIRREVLEGCGGSDAPVSPSTAGKLSWYRAVNSESGRRLVKRLVGKCAANITFGHPSRSTVTNSLAFASPARTLSPEG